MQSEYAIAVNSCDEARCPRKVLCMTNFVGARVCLGSSSFMIGGVHPRFQQQGDASQNGAIVVHESAIPVVIARRVFERHGEILKVLREFKNEYYDEYTFDETSDPIVYARDGIIF